MFYKKTENPVGLDLVIKLATEDLATKKPDSEEYAKIVEQLDKLYKMKTSTRDNRVSKDGLIAVAGNLFGIGLILNYERLHVVTSKAVGFVTKSRI